jgi:uncharacterized protein YqhQ
VPSTATVSSPAVARDGSQAQPAASRDHDGYLNAQRDAPVGGQAVIEGVMMRGVRHWAVAVRKPPAPEPSNGAQPAALAEPEQANGAQPAATSELPTGAPPAALAAPERSNGAQPATAAAVEQPDGVRADGVEGAEHSAPGEIEVRTFELRSAQQRHRLLRVPVVRGVVALASSLAIGFRALELAANAQLPADENEGQQEIPRGMWAGTIVVALALAVVLFFLIPVGLTSLIKDQLGSSWLFWLVEGSLRTAIFLGYLLALSRVRDLRRVFEYHGAEHKTISCYEAGLELTPGNCARFSRLHPRCGTSFLLVVMIVAIFVFAPIGLPAWYWLLLTRILGIPIIAGVSFELIKFAGKNRRRRWVRALMWPGLKLQLLTTREPDSSQLSVAIKALEAVLARETPGQLSAADLVGVELVA